VALDFEVSLQNYKGARDLYKQLLNRTQHVKVWISYARFEMDTGHINEARDIYTKAFNMLKQEDMKAEVRKKLFLKMRLNGFKTIFLPSSEWF